jgi:hypothetical protein
MEEAGPLKGSPVSVRLRPGVLINGMNYVPIVIEVPAETMTSKINFRRFCKRLCYFVWPYLYR